ncbi:probable septum site-determining protein MinC [Clostridium sp. CAG:306]|nr:probable septum site-determining protein MinC [Clostridium sp. CAG:306]
MELNNRYIIDLSQANSPADIVFELSNIIEKEEAANKRIWLKLGDITLNQSQILSINSLISSINSTLSLIESASQQTELAAATLGISTKDVEEELQEELSNLEAQAPEDEPSEQYIPMTEHIEEEEPEEKEEEEEEEQSQEEEPEQASEQEEAAENEIVEEPQQTGSAADVDIVFNKQNPEEEKAAIEQSQTSFSVVDDKKDEEIQQQLDSIFDSETKLENILSEEKDLNEMKNWPLTKEAEDNFEIPEEVMTDEDYEILQMNTQYHKQTVRSGQVIKSNGNVVIIGDCHPGCEIHAAGDITVWGILGGIAHAGYKGNTKAKIRALNLNAIQLRIADSYARRPDHIKNIYVEKSNTFTPEEARNINGSIVILKINDK